jgi:23S rRNA pseudouridine1911/1915/1917 synthase
VGLVHRLDRPVSGIVVFAKTSKSARRLSEQFRSGSVDKRYLAVVHVPRIPSPDNHGTWAGSLVKDEKTNRVRAGSPDEGKLAKTAWTRLESTRSFAVLELKPMTGRSHQLRAQCSAAGMPIVGDRKYGAPTSNFRGVALHAWSLSFAHPTRDETISITCPPPESWKQFPSALIRLQICE